MNSDRLSTRELGQWIVLALVFVAIGGAIIIVFSPYRPLLGRVADYLGRLGLIAALTAAAAWASKNQGLVKYRPLLLGLLILSAAVSLDLVFSIFLLKHLAVDDRTPAGFALLKLNEALVVIAVVVLLTRLSGSSLGSIYLHKGNLRSGLTIGLIAFVLAAVGSIPMAGLMFNAPDLTLARILPWLPWVLVFVLANASLEEILFRGVFLRKLQPFFGRFLSNFLLAFVFTGMHKGVGYSADEYIFLAILIPLALVWGYIMQKTDSVWGSILFHAGMDIPIALGIFSNF